MGTSCRARGSPTRSRLRRPRRLPPSTLPSTGRWPELWEMLRLWLMPMNRHSPSKRPVLGLSPLDLSKYCHLLCSMFICTFIIKQFETEFRYEIEFLKYIYEGKFKKK